MKGSDFLFIKPESIWSAYQLYSSMSAVRRKGYELVGMTASTTGMTQDEAISFMLRGESDLEHQAKVAWLAMAMRAAGVEGFFDYSEMKSKEFWILMSVALCHDIGEAECGDIPDDGSPEHDSKSAVEREVFNQIALELFDSLDDYHAMSNAFCHFQDKDTHNGKALYALDKLDAVLTQLFYEKQGCKGTMFAKEHLTDSDRYYMQITASDSSTDCWAAHLCALIRDFPETIKGPVLELVDVAVKDVRRESFLWWGVDIVPFK